MSRHYDTMIMHIYSWALQLALALVVFVSDRLLKVWALMYCSERVDVLPFLSCELTFNRGISWGLFSGVSRFWIISVVMVSVVLFFAYRLYNYSDSILRGLGESLVIAGALGNLADRFYYGAVIDFIVVGYHGWYWPVFNIADSAIVIGVGIMIWNEF